MTAAVEPDAIGEIGRFLDGCRRDDVWSRTPDAPETPHSLYHGTAGVVLFLLERHRASDEQAHLDKALAAGDVLVEYLVDPTFLSCAIYSGWPGYVFVLNELAKASGEVRFRDASVSALERLMAQSQPLGSGLGWIEPMPFSDITGITGEREVLDLSIGAAGVGVVLLYAHREGLHVESLSWARAVADRLIEMAVMTDTGPNWLMMADMPFPFTASNFAHGGAGVGYFLADLHRETGDQQFLDIAIAAAEFVLTQAVPTTDPDDASDSFLIRHTQESRPRDLCYLGVCHGPPGTGRLFHLLNEITGDPRWRTALDANLHGLLATGAPEARSAGLWQNYGQCCGDAGIGDYALGLFRATGEQRYLDLAQRCGTTMLAASSTGEGRYWTQAEHRTRPEHLEAQTGYMQGAAGIGSFLLHLATVETDSPSKIWLPDSPF